MILDQHELVYFFLKDVIDQYGVDATRLAILGTVPPKANREWSEQGNTCTCTFHNPHLDSNCLQIKAKGQIQLYYISYFPFLRTFSSQGGLRNCSLLLLVLFQHL